MDIGLGAFIVVFVVPVKPPVIGEPSEGAFDNPAFGQDVEPLDATRKLAFAANRSRS